MTTPCRSHLALLVSLAMVVAACGIAGTGTTQVFEAPGTAHAVATSAVSSPTMDPVRAVSLTLAARVVAERGDLLPVGGDGSVEPYRTGPSAASPEVIPPPPLRRGSGTLYAVGDSVLLGAEPYLRTTLAGWDARVDARVSRTVPEGFSLVRTNADRIGDALILVLGHNYGGGGFTGWLDSLLTELSGVQRVVLVTVAEWSRAQPEVNAAIRRAPERHPNVVVADWAAVLAANPGFLADHVHPNRAGAIALANLIAVMTGPAPSPDGSVISRPHLLTIPAIGSGSSTGGSTSASPTTTWSATSPTVSSPTGGGGGTSSPTTASGATSTTLSSDSTTTAAPTTAAPTTAAPTTAAPTTAAPTTAAPTTAAPTTTAPTTTAPPPTPDE